MVLLAGLLGAAPAFAQDSPDELARRHFESGVAYLQESDFDNALKAFEKSYELSKRPDLLLNIATVHERKGDFKSAVTSLKRYLEASPESDQKATVEARIANLEKRIQDAEAAKAAEPTPNGAGSGGKVTAQDQTPKGTEASPAPKSNLPAFVLFGVAGLSAAGAVVTGVMANGKYNDAKDSCSPRCTDDELSSGKTLALTSTILTGVAVASAGVGAVLFFTNRPTTEKAARRPRRFDLGFAVVPGGGGAAASYRF